jgi:hypothetical protein
MREDSLSSSRELKFLNHEGEGQTQKETMKSLGEMQTNLRPFFPGLRLCIGDSYPDPIQEALWLEEGKQSVPFCILLFIGTG